MIWRSLCPSASLMGLLLTSISIACGDDTSDKSGIDSSHADVVPFVESAELDEAPAVPSDSPIRKLKVEYESVPASFPAGDELEFVVSLTNPTGEDVILEPCPAYKINLGESATIISSELRRLNCAAGDRVPAHGSLSFEMKIQTYPPYTQPDGLYVLVWFLEPNLGRDIVNIEAT